jgi:hypothetical protein
MEGDHSMINAETVALTALITQIWPSMKLNEYSADAWHPVLEDLPYAAAEHAVLILAKSHPGYIQPYDIRRQAAKTAGLLAPDEADALQLALDVAGAQGTGASMLPPAVKDAYWAMGGSQGFAAMPAVLRPQWGRVYRDCVAAREEQLLAGDLGLAIENSRPVAIAAAPARHDTETPAMSAEATEHNQKRLEREFLRIESRWNRASIAVPAAPAPPKADPGDDPELADAQAILAESGSDHAWRIAARAELETEGAVLTHRAVAIRAADMATRPETEIS